MRELDRITIEECGVPGYELMTRAGRGLAACLKKKMLVWQIPTPRILFIAGRGNNGGDACVAARILHGENFRVSVHLLGDPGTLQGDARTAYDDMTEAGVPCQISTERYSPESMDAHTILVDGILGTGFSGEPRGLAREAIGVINQHCGTARVVAIDLPSGLNPDTGVSSKHTVRSDISITMGLPKKGMIVPSATEFVGEIVTIDIGLPTEGITGQNEGCIEWLSPSDIVLPTRGRSTHKGDYGHMLFIGGTTGFSGAAIMAGRAALRTGAGLVSAIVPDSVAQYVAASTPEMMVHPGASTEQGSLSRRALSLLDTGLKNCNAVLAGPGMTTCADTEHIVHHLLSLDNTPVTLDADALNVLAGQLKAMRRATNTVILTPHPGEMARLLDTSIQAVQADRLGAVKEAVEQSGAYIVLKGAGSVIGGPDMSLFVNTTGNPGMATGGSGDVLAGMIAGMVAQGFTAEESLAFGVYMHGVCGDRAAGRYTQPGMTAMDLIGELPGAMKAFGIK